MTGPGDITDEFDDEALRSSIENAGAAGEWRDEAGRFLDPKLENLRKQLSEPERAPASYAERRLRELQQRTAGTAAAAPPRRAPEPPAGSWGDAARAPEPLDEVAPGAAPTEGALANLFADDPPSSRGRGANAEASGGATARTASTTSAASSAAAPAPSYVAAARSTHPVLTTIRPMLVGCSVFAPATVAQAAIAGFHADLLLRLPIGALLAGFLWQRFGAGRLRAVAIGVAVHVLAFCAPSLRWSTPDVIAVGTGLAIVLVGSLVVGSSRGSRSLRADRR